MYIVGCLAENLPPHNFTNFLSGPSREPQANPIYHQIDSISLARLLIGCQLTRRPAIGWSRPARLPLVEVRAVWRSILGGFIPPLSLPLAPARNDKINTLVFTIMYICFYRATHKRWPIQVCTTTTSTVCPRSRAHFYTATPNKTQV